MFKTQPILEEKKCDRVCGVGGTCCGVICVVREIYRRVVVVCWVQWCVLRMCGVRGVRTSIVTKQFVFCVESTSGMSKTTQKK